MSGPIIQAGFVTLPPYEPPPPSGDPATIEILAQISPPASAQFAAALDALIVKMKDPARWSAAGAFFAGMDMIQVYAGSTRKDIAKIDWKVPTRHAEIGSKVDLTATGGLKTSVLASENDYEAVINTNWIPDTATGNFLSLDCGFGFMMSENPAAQGPLIGIYPDGGGITSGIRAFYNTGGGGSMRWYLNGTGSSELIGSMPLSATPALWSIRRLNNSLSVDRDGAQVRTATNTGAGRTYSRPLIVGASNESLATLNVAGVPARYPIIFAGRQLTTAENATLKADVLQFIADATA